MKSKSVSILIVDDEHSIRQTVRMMLEEEYSVMEAGDRRQALAALREKEVDIIFMDIYLGADSGIGALPEIIEADPEAVVIMLSVEKNHETVIECMRLGAFDFVTKPFHKSDLTAAIERAKSKRALKRAQDFISWSAEEEAYKFELVGESETIRKVKNQIAALSKVDTHVLITGETGTGKEIVARTMHRSGMRAAKPFIPVNCAALTESLIESELFGHEDGAFTGAKGRKKGIFEMAHGGTVLLDEIRELSDSSQAKILRILQEGDFTRIGDSRTRFTDVVVYATTNKDLEELVKAGKFRDDLYYRLNQAEIKVPPLRERLSDIPLLVNHFIRKNRYRFKSAPEVINPEIIEHLMDRSDWDGNVRELENMVLKLLVSGRDSLSVFFPDSSAEPGPDVRMVLPFIKNIAAEIPLSKESVSILREYVADFSRLLFRHFLKRLKREHNGSVKQIAEHSGIGRTHLYKLYEYANKKLNHFREYTE